MARKVRPLVPFGRSLPTMNRTVDVVIVGAGPVGLFLGCCLQERGVSFVILEKRTEPSHQSRSIGIHPPSLELLDRTGLAEKLIECGVKIRRGAACCGRQRLGDVNFARGPGEFGFILSVPQHMTERVLSDRLQQDVVRRGDDVVGLKDEGDCVRVMAREASGKTEWCAKFVAGCDGPASTVRKLIGSSFDGGAYPDFFAMGDFADTTGWGAEARIFLDSRGFIESFPLPGNMRRWVMRTCDSSARSDQERFAAEVEERCRVKIGDAIEPMSTFGVSHFLASDFSRGRVALAGDAAHVMSPFGGQGMNIGWMDAWDLAGTISERKNLGSYPNRAHKRAGAAIRRAEQNLAIGRGFGMPRLRTALVSAALHLPIQSWIVHRFTLRGI